MINFEHTEVFNVEGALRGMRNSWESWDKSDSKWSSENGEWWYEIGPDDKKLSLNLAKAGTEHAKYLRQIMISVDIIAPLKWWDEVDTYHFFETNSTSAMHTLGKGEIGEEAFSFEDCDQDLKEAYLTLLNTARNRWVDSGKKKPSREWRQMIMLTGMGFNYKRTFTSNYSQLRNMYFQRKNHRLQEWRDFCKWVESLPFSELITLKTPD